MIGGPSGTYVPLPVPASGERILFCERWLYWLARGDSCMPLVPPGACSAKGD